MSNSDVDVDGGGAPGDQAKTVPTKVRYDYTGRALRVYPSWLPYLTAFICIISGVFCSIAFKWHLKQKAPECSGCAPAEFHGALLQTQWMFVAESLAFVIWWIDDIFSRKQKKIPLFEFITSIDEIKRPAIRWWWFPISALHDFTGTLMINTSMNYTYASTVQMLRNFMVVGCAIIQMFLIKKALLVHEWVGVLVITGAMILTAIPAFAEPEDTGHSSGEITLGIVLAIVGTVLQGGQLLTEEFWLRKGRYPTMKAVGVEGFSGTIYCLIVWGPYQRFGAEAVNTSWYMQFHSGMLGLITGLYVPAATIFNGAGLATTKLAGGLLRGVCFACRAPLVWLVSLAVKWQGYDNWNLASMIVFIIAFAMYVNQLPWLKNQVWWVKPIHFCCTDPALDGVTPGMDMRRLEEDEEKHEYYSARLEV